MTLASRPLLVITGPTGGGKSALALQLAAELQGEIINADSVQLYQDFVIGASQPTQSEMQQVAHHLYGCVHPSERIAAGEYIRLADQAITEVASRGKAPIVVGGTGLYIRALLHGLVEVPEIPESVQQQIVEELEELRSVATTPEDYEARVTSLLLRQDPIAAEKLRPSDTQRVARALAVYTVTGRSLFEFHEEHARGKPRVSALVVNVLPERSLLYQRINNRVGCMWEQGLVEEVQLLAARYGTEVHPFRSIGYRHVLEFLDNRASEQDTRSVMAQDTRRFAKRQTTWWRHEPGRLNWQHISAQKQDSGIATILNNYNELCGCEQPEDFPILRYMAMEPSV